MIGSHKELVLRRSHDGGRSWSNISYPCGFHSARCLRNDSNSNAELEQPQLGFDHASGTVLLFFTHRVPTPQGGGCDAGELNEDGFWLIRSSDRGASWSEPRDVQATLQDKPTFSAKGCMAPNAGQAIQLRPGSPHAGRLLFGGQSDSYNGSVVLFSENGRSWDWTDSLHKPGLDECSLAQLPNGSVMAIMRNCYGQQCQLLTDEQAEAVGSKRFAYAVSTDGGESFGDIKNHEDLVTPVCEASLLGYNGSLLFVGPYSEVRRENLTVLASDDNGLHFRRSLQLDPGGAGYTSVQCGLPAPDDCAVLYNNEGYALGKGGSDLVFKRFSSAHVKSDDEVLDLAPPPSSLVGAPSPPSPRLPGGKLMPTTLHIDWELLPPMPVGTEGNSGGFFDKETLVFVFGLGPLYPKPSMDAFAINVSAPNR